MKRLYIFFILFFSFFWTSIPVAHAQILTDQPTSTNETYVKGAVTQVIKQETQQIGGYTSNIQVVKVRLETGDIVTIQRGSDIRLFSNQLLSPGEEVIVDVLTRPGTTPQYTITDTYRLTPLLFLGIIFFLLIISMAGKKGFGAVLGLVVSLCIIMLFMVPQILHHQDPLLISIISCVGILLITTYLAHGFSKQTTLAVISTCIALMFTYLFSVIAVHITHLAGLGTEDSYLLELNPEQRIDPRGLLLGGILIGTLGALNDITTTQVASLVALFKQNSKLSVWHLAEQGFVIGREHIASLVNTLVLAYAGTSLPIFIFFVLNPAHLPWWVILNNESVSEEIIRTVTGSIGLIVAVPITTFLASWWITKNYRT